jgi:hypothetical protein
VLRGDVPIATWSLIAFGVGGLVALGRRLYKLNVDHSEFHRALNANRREYFFTNITTNRRELWQRYAQTPRMLRMEPSRKLLEKVMASPVKMLWSRVRRRGLGASHGLGSFVIWFAIAVWIQLPVFFAFLYIPNNNTSNNNSSAMSMIFVIVMPTMIICQRVWNLRQTLGPELLRPATRSQFLSEWGLAIALEQARACLAMMLALALFDGLAGWPLLTSTHGWMMIMVMMASQVSLFGMGIWMLRYRLKLLVMVSVFYGFVWAVCIIPAVTHHLHRSFSAPWLAGIAVLMLLIGTGLIYDARKRWLQTELG